MMDQSVILLLIGLMTLLLILTIFWLVIYSGLLSDINVGVGKPPISEVVVYYKFGRGSYRDIMGTSYIFTEVTSIAPKNKCFGVYYDNPDKVPAEKLRWAVGVIVRENTLDLDPVVVDKLRTEGYKEFGFPKVENVVKAEFPCKTQISVLLGVYKAYPKLEEYVEEMKLCAHPWLEIYDGDIVHFIAPLSKQESFYVPEALAKTNTDISDIKNTNKRTRLYSGKEQSLLSESSELELQEKQCDKKEPITSNNSVENKTYKSESLSNSIASESDARSKSVNILPIKQTMCPSEKMRSKSLTQGKPSFCTSKNLQKEKGGMGFRKICDSDTPIANTGLESLDPDCSMDSYTYSFNSTNETRESSCYSSEYSYTSQSSIASATCTELSSDSDENPEDASSVIKLKEKDHKKTPEN